MNKELAQVISEIPLFSDLSQQQIIENFKTEKLPSLSNKTYKIALNQTSYILKIPQNHTNQYVSRDNEIHNADLAFKLGIGPEVIWLDSNGVYLISYISNSRYITQNDLQNPIILKQLANILIDLQSYNVSFLGDIHNPDIILKVLNTYYGNCCLEEKERLQTIYSKGLSSINHIREYDLPAIPSHVDLSLGNILIENNKQQRIWLIDWEYSAMASPFWDIATICNQAEFDDAKAAEFLATICSNKSNFEPSKHLKLLIDYRNILSAVSQCWLSAYNNHPTPNISDG